MMSVTGRHESVQLPPQGPQSPSCSFSRVGSKNQAKEFVRPFYTMVDLLSDMPLVPLVASSLQRLKYSPSSHPYYGRISLYDQANNRFGAKALHHRALWPAVPDDHRQPDKRTMEIEVAKWSTEDVEFRACVLPERGFCKEWR